MTTDLLREFLINSKKKGYAGGDNTIVDESDTSHSTRYSESDFSFHDNWFGGEPFGGREVVFYQNKPYWMMTYYGADTGRVKGLIDFLRKALSQISEDLPLRGPKLFEEGDFKYENKLQGKLENFIGEEKIFYKGEKVFRTNYVGGLVDRRGDQ